MFDMFDKKKFKKRILFVGIPDMAYICLDGLKMSGVNIVGVVGPKKKHATYDAFRDFVKSRGVEFIEWNGLTDCGFLEKIKSLDVDLAVVCSFNYKIPKEFLKLAKDGFLNIHPSLLPEYRGANPYSHVIFNMEKETGVSVHFMDEDYDTGDIVMQKSTPLNAKETMGTLFNRLNLLGLEMLLEILGDYETGKLPRVAQVAGSFKIGGGINDGDLFIDYNNSAKSIEAFIRGLNPFMIASTSFRGTFMKIFSADYVDATLDYPCGTIAKVDDENIYISTKNGFLVPKVMQFGSFFVGSSADFIRFLNPKVGEEFK